ncbi:hypothetical protein TNCV_1461281 [Trichonephila clavipes]|nr:hypothetical protein TNCV_1461281 [Trichonephila clavipes]
MENRKETTIEERKLVIKLPNEGKSLQNIAKVVGQSVNCIQKILQKSKKTASTFNNLGRYVSAETVRRVLRKVGYNGRVTRKKAINCLSFEHLAGDITILVVPPQRRASHLSSPSPDHMRDLAARRLFRVPSCHKGTIHLQTLMSSPRFEPSPYSTAVSVANHYTGWVTIVLQFPANDF